MDLFEVSVFCTHYSYTGESDSFIFLNFACFPQEPEDTPPPTKIETREERLERRRREKAEQVAYKLEQEIALCECLVFNELSLPGHKIIMLALLTL